MPKKISDFLKTNLEPESDLSDAAVKYEKEGDFVINLDEIEKEIKIPPKIREFQVMLKDVKEEVDENNEAPKKSSNSKKKVNCNFCGNIFSSKKTLLAHSKTFHANEMENLLSCHICKATFFQKHKLERHKNKQHFPGFKSEFVCDFDGRFFITRRKLLSHMRVHQMVVKCEICQIEIKPGSMSTHKKQIHSTEQKLQCKICSKNYKTISTLKKHEKNHDKKFGCEICSKKFPYLSYLNSHKKEFHENFMGFECKICNKNFNQKSNLRTHEKTHDKNRLKPFKCQQCGYATDIMQYYRNHKNFHERQDRKFAAMKNPLKCEKCSIFCKDKNFLLIHMKYVHPENLFQCDLCGSYLKAMNSLKYHLNNHLKVMKN